MAEENSLSKDRGKPSPVILCCVCTGTMRLETLPVHTSRQSYSTVLDFPQLRNSKYYYKDASDYINNKTFYLFLFGCWFATHIIQLPSQLQHFIDNKTFYIIFSGGCWLATWVICRNPLRGKYCRKIIALASELSWAQDTLPAGNLYNDCSLSWPSSLISYS